jgi:GntR family transcriptional regulator
MKVRSSGRGVGTFIADRPHLSNKLNINWGVTQIIQATGATPGISEMNFDIQPASRRMVEHLQVDLGAPILLVERVRTADATPVSISIDYLALERIRCGKPVDECVEHFRSFLEQYQSIYRFLEKELGLEKGHATAWLRPMVANEDMAMKLDVPLHSPILYLEQLDNDLEGNPLLLTDEYFAGDAFIFSVHRPITAGCNMPKRKKLSSWWPVEHRLPPQPWLQKYCARTLSVRKSIRSNFITAKPPSSSRKLNC